ncbi:MAG: hypothetical protein ABW214_01750 [Terrimicrobiaceae bacterium]
MKKRLTTFSLYTDNPTWAKGSRTLLKKQMRWKPAGVTLKGSTILAWFGVARYLHDALMSVADVTGFHGRSSG